MAKSVGNLFRNKKIAERYEERRKNLWPDVDRSKIWNRVISDGYTTIPRTLNLIATIADDLATKSKRVSATYIGLWCRVWDAGVVEISNEWEMATESGFTGERRVYTWRDRIKELIDLGFILTTDGPKGPYQYILIINPYHVVYDLNNAGKISKLRWTAVLDRSLEIGAKDIEQYEEALKKGEKEDNGENTEKAEKPKKTIKTKSGQAKPADNDTPI